MGYSTASKSARLRARCHLLVVARACLRVRRRLLVAAGCVLATLAAAAPALARTVGTVPPYRPKANCSAPGGPTAGLPQINRCRAAEGLGTMTLPSNWSRLGAADQLLVVLNLERVNRGLAPIVGLSGTLNGLAGAGASSRTDPTFPAAGFRSGGVVWAGGDTSVLGADDDWMYHDGVGGGNVDCTGSITSGCWEHRDNILADSSKAPLVAGAAVIGRSYAVELLSGYSTKGLSFTWKGELRYFKDKPGLDPLPRAVTNH
jgi:hypothetical protein